MELLWPLLPGLGVTVLLFAGGALVAAVCAFGAGLASLSRDPIVRGAAGAYVAAFRGTSLVVQLYWFAAALPLLLGLDVSVLAVAMIVPGINVGAYGAEVVRTAIRDVARGQHDAATALALTPRQRMRHVVLPQALVAMIPPFGNLLIELLKSTSLVALIAVPDLTLRGRFVAGHKGNRADVITTWLLVMGLYFALSRLIGAGTRGLERRLGRGLDRGGIR